MITSPCVQICTIEPASGLCAGCGRTLDEIAGWAAMDSVQRFAIMAALPQRMAKAGLKRKETAT